MRVDLIAGPGDPVPVDERVSDAGLHVRGQVVAGGQSEFGDDREHVALMRAHVGFLSQQAGRGCARGFARHRDGGAAVDGDFRAGVAEGQFAERFERPLVPTRVRHQSDFGPVETVFGRERIQFVDRGADWHQRVGADRGLEIADPQAFVQLQVSPAGQEIEVAVAHLPPRPPVQHFDTQQAAVGLGLDPPCQNSGKGHQFGVRAFEAGFDVGERPGQDRIPAAVGLEIRIAGHQAQERRLDAVESSPIEPVAGGETAAGPHRVDQAITTEQDRRRGLSQDTSHVAIGAGRTAGDQRRRVHALDPPHEIVGTRPDPPRITPVRDEHSRIDTR